MGTVYSDTLKEIEQVILTVFGQRIEEYSLQTIVTKTFMRKRRRDNV